MQSSPGFVPKTKSELKRTNYLKTASTPTITPTFTKHKMEILIISAMNWDI